MKNTLFIIGRIIAVLVFILAFSIAGVVSGKPIMILAFAGFFILIMFITFLFVRKNQRHFEIISQGNRTIAKIVGILLILIALALPALAISTMQIIELGSQNIGFSTLAVVFAITLTLMICGVLSVYLINRTGSKLWHKILGYLIIIIACAIPALMVIPYDRTTTGIGSIYYLTLMVAVLSWWGFSLFLNKE
jgi:hypothetical protein